MSLDKQHLDVPRPKGLKLALMGTRGIPARYGGFETFAEQLSQRLVARGHDVTVYGRCGIFERWGAREPLNGVKRRVAPTIFHKYLETPLHALSSALDLLITQRGIDGVILCNGANSPFAPLILLKGVPLLINVDGIERERAKWNCFGKLWYLLGERCSVLFASRVISDADVIADYYIKRYGVNTTVIPYGVHPCERRAGEVLKHFGLHERGYLLYVSRLEPENNALGVIEAYREVEPELRSRMPLVIVGDAPYAAEYKERLRRASIGLEVIFTGFQFGESYEELQSNCYLYIQATEVGGTHPALIESMSYGNCVVANGTPENVEVVGEAGVVYARNNFKALAAILSGLITDSERVANFGKAAKARASERYSWDSVVARYEELLVPLL
jgi:glycosyltransferase involved in cell wall biosynthesis